MRHEPGRSDRNGPTKAIEKSRESKPRELGQEPSTLSALTLTYSTGHPFSGDYELALKAVGDRPKPLGEIPHDTGLAPRTTPLPTRTRPVNDVDIHVSLDPVVSLRSRSVALKAGPNHEPEQATVLGFPASDAANCLQLVDGTDEIECYNDTRSRPTEDDWYRIFLPQ